MLNSGSKRPHDISIHANKFSNCGEDCFQPQAAGTFTLSDNDFIGPADENLVDIKSAQADSFIFDNLFRCDNSNRACLLLHGRNARGAAVIIEGNLFSECPRMSALQLRLGRQGIDNTYHVRDNTFDLSDALCRALVVKTCGDCDISDNLFYEGWDGKN